MTAANNGTSVALSGATIPASGSCTVTVNVTSAVAATYNNTIAIGALTTTNAGANLAAASDTITFLNALTVAKMRAMPTSRTTHECEIVNGQGMKVLPRPLAGALPVAPFAGYFGLLSRSPERHAPQGVSEAP